MALFHELHAQGNTIVLITHDESVANQAERRIYIKDGQVQAVGLEDKAKIDSNTETDLTGNQGKECR